MIKEIPNSFPCLDTLIQTRGMLRDLRKACKTRGMLPDLKEAYNTQAEKIGCSNYGRNIQK